MFRAFLTLSGLTSVSRLLGYIRDILISNYLGASWASDAFFTGFRFPNLFRRIFGEGAFNAGFVPLFSKALEEQGREAAVKFSNQVLSLLGIFLLAMTVLFIFKMEWLITLLAPGFKNQPETLALATNCGKIMFSYLFCMSLTAQLGGILNTLKKFAAVGFAPILLNLCFLVTLLVYIPFLKIDHNLSSIAYALSIAVCAAGFMQLSLLWVCCYKAGIRLRFAFPKITRETHELFKLIVPGILASSVQQLNIFIGHAIASGQESAISYLYFADRVNQLPIGIVGISYGVILLPLISRKLSAKQPIEAQADFIDAAKKCLWIAMPAATIMLVLPYEIIHVLFYRGKFTLEDTAQTALVLQAFAVGLPFYVLNKVFQTPYFATLDTKKPMIISIISIIINTVLGWLWFKSHGAVGIALATSVAAGIQNISLAVFLPKPFGFTRSFYFYILKLIGLCLIFAAALYALTPLGSQWTDLGNLLDFVFLGVWLLVAGTLYLLGSHFFKVIDVTELKKLVKK